MYVVSSIIHLGDEAYVLMGMLRDKSSMCRCIKNMTYRELTDSLKMQQSSTVALPVVLYGCET